MQQPDPNDALIIVDVVVLPDEPKRSLARRAWRWLKGLFA